MAFIDKLLSNKYPFNENSVNKILQAIIYSKETDKSSLESVISCKTRDSRPTDTDIQQFRHHIGSIVSKAIIKNDFEHATELTKVDANKLKEILTPHMYEEYGEEYNIIVKLKQNALKLVDYKDNDVRKNYTFNSYILFPHNEELNKNQKVEHMITINATPDKYLEIFNEVFNKMVDEKIPVDMSLRDIEDMYYGFANPISIYTSTEHLERVSELVYSVLRKYERNVIKPNNILYLSVEGLFGYTTIKDGKTPMNEILDRLEKTINTHLAPKDTRDWKERAQILKKYIKDHSSSDYEKMVSDIGNSVFYSDRDGYALDFENIYVYPDVFEKEEVKEETPTDINSIKTKTPEEMVEDLPTGGIVDEVEEEVVDEEPSLENTGIYANDQIKVESLSNEEAYSVVANNMETKKEEDEVYAKEYEHILMDQNEYADLFERGGWEDATHIIVNEKGEYAELIKYLKIQGASYYFDKEITLKDGRVMTGKDYVRQIVIECFKNNSKDKIHTLESVNNEYIADIRNLPKENIFTKIFSRKKVR